MNKKWQKVVFLVCIVMFVGAGLSWGHGVVVVPLLSSKKTQNVVKVAKSGGDFVDPIAAVASITDASDDNRYLVIIGPGKYELSEQLVLKEYVSIAGSGEYTTILQGSVSAADYISSALLLCENLTSVSGMLVYNTGGGQSTVGIGVESGNEVILQHIRIIAEGGDERNAGIYNLSDELTVRDGTSTGKGGDIAYGMLNSYADPEVSGMRLNGLGKGVFLNSNRTRGVYNVNSSPTFRNVKAFAANTSHVAPNASVGMLNSGSESNPTVMNSELKGGDAGIDFGSGGLTSRIISNLITPGILNNPAGSQCGGNYNGDTMAYISC